MPAPLLARLEELRARLLYSLAAVVVGCGIAAAFLSRIVDWILRPLASVLPPGVTFIYTEPAEALLLQLRIALLAGMALAAPFVLLQVWLLAAPALYRAQKRLAAVFVVLASSLFVVGCLFSHFVVFPMTWRFFAGFATDVVTFRPRLAETFALYVRLLLAFGVAFELPTAALFLARMGLLTPGFMLRHLKYAVLVVFIVAAVITPTPDMVVQSAMAVPMLGLYLLSIGVAWAFGRPRGE